MPLKSQSFLMRIVQKDSGLGLKVRNGSSGVQIFQHSMPAIIKKINQIVGSGQTHR